MLDRSLRAGALALALALGMALPAAAQSGPTALRFGWVNPDSTQDPYAIGANLFKQKVEARVPGRLQINLFPARQIGDEKAMVEGLRFGTVDMAIITNAVIANVETGFQLNDLPFLYADEAQAHRVLDGPVGKELASRLARKGIVLLGFMDSGFRNMVNNVRPVVEPADVKGVKYRVMQNPVYIDMFSTLGGNAIPMAWGEVFTAMQQGTVDGLEIPLTVIESNKYYEVAKYLSLTNHTCSVIGLLIAQRTMAKLPQDVQDAIVAAAAEATIEQRKRVAALSENILTVLQGRGMTINRVKDPAAFRATVKPVYEKFRASIGPALLDQALAAVN